MGAKVSRLHSVSAVRDWTLGFDHRFPKFGDQDEQRRAIVERLRVFRGLLRERHPDVWRWPEYHTLAWAHGQSHGDPILLPGEHALEMKRLRRESFWRDLEAGNENIRHYPEYQVLAWMAGFRREEELPIVRMARPNTMPRLRSTSSRRTRRGYQRALERWQSEYGPARREVIKILKRKRRQLLDKVCY